MNRISKFIALGVFGLVVLALPSIASAQWYPGNNGGYGNGGYGNGRYGNNLENVADRLVRQSKDFENRVDNTVDNRNDRWGNRNGGYYNNDLKQLAGDFRRAAENFENKYGRGRDMRNSEDAARRLLDAASRMDNALRNNGGWGNNRNNGGWGNNRNGRYGSNNNNLNGQWNSMRGDVNAIANAYGYNGGYNNRYPSNNRNGDWRNRIPFPLPF